MENGRILPILIWFFCIVSQLQDSVATPPEGRLPDANKGIDKLIGSKLIRSKGLLFSYLSKSHADRRVQCDSIVARLCRYFLRLTNVPLFVF